jgi:hypothetical protein
MTCSVCRLFVKVTLVVGWYSHCFGTLPRSRTARFARPFKKKKQQAENWPTCPSAVGASRSRPKVGFFGQALISIK